MRWPARKWASGLPKSSRKFRPAIARHRTPLVLFKELRSRNGGLSSKRLASRWIESIHTDLSGVANTSVLMPIATGDILTARRRFRGIADMDRFSSRNDL